MKMVLFVYVVLVRIIVLVKKVSIYTNCSRFHASLTRCSKQRDDDLYAIEDRRTVSAYFQASHQRLSICWFRLPKQLLTHVHF